MKISTDGVLPQFELGPNLGGLKVLYQRAGVVMRTITMVSAMTSAWATSGTVRAVFGGSAAAFFGTALLIGVLWMVFDYVALIPSEQTFRNGQSERTERSPLKNDTEAILKELRDE